MKQNRKEKGSIEKLLHIRVDVDTHSDICLLAHHEEMSLSLFYKEIFKEYSKMNAARIQEIKQQTGAKKWN